MTNRINRATSYRLACLGDALRYRLSRAMCVVFGRHGPTCAGRSDHEPAAQWPRDDAMIYRSAHVKARAMQEDPNRYFAVVRAQRDAQIRGLPIPADEEVR